jgi:hypothetical protein
MCRDKYRENDMQKLTVQLLKTGAKAFADRESGHKEKSLFGVTDGKAVGTYLEHKFQGSAPEEIRVRARFLGERNRLSQVGYRHKGDQY